MPLIGRCSPRARRPLLWALALLLFPVPVPATGMMERLAQKIVRPDDSDDAKIRKIERWVRKNIEYVSDEELYGRPNVQYHPSVTIRKGKADSEDGAMLTHALAAYAGIPLRRLRTITGFKEGGGQEEMHTWTLYKRPQDDAWVVVDWTRRRHGGAVRRRPVLWSTPGYGEFRVLAYMVVEKLRPFRVGYVQIGGEVPISRLGLPGELDRLLGSAPPP